MNQFDYNEPPEIQAAAQRVRAAAFGKYRPENWKEPEPAEPKPLRLKPSPTPGSGAHHLNRTEKLGIRGAVGRPRKHPKKYSPYTGRTRGWNKKPIPDEKILAMRAEGLSYAKIGAEVGLNSAAVHRRVKRLEAKA